MKWLVYMYINRFRFNFLSYRKVGSKVVSWKCGKCLFVCRCGSGWYIPMGSYIPIIGHLLFSDIPTVNTKILPIKPTQFGSNTFTIFCQIIIKDLSLWDDWSYKEPKEILCFWSRSISLFEKKYTIKKTGWRLSWVIVWLKYFHCLKVKTLLGFYWNGKYNLVLIIR